jgi:hypothetical protein
MIPEDSALLSDASVAALRQLIGCSLRGAVVDVALVLRPRGQFTTEGRYDVTWSSFVIEPVKPRFSAMPMAATPVLCRTQQIEINGVLVTRLEAALLSQDMTPAGRIAQHATGAISMFPLSRIEIWSRDMGFPLADEYNNASEIPADRRIRFVAVSPKGNEGGFSLVIPNSGAGLYFMREDDMEIVSMPEEQHAHGHLSLRLMIEGSGQMQI